MTNNVNSVLNKISWKPIKIKSKIFMLICLEWNIMGTSNTPIFYFGLMVHENEISPLNVVWKTFGQWSVNSFSFHKWHSIASVKMMNN